ncbi:MAG: apolipoprotein N-acyltransferase [Alphaproteobacteria bacterium]|jgi:apolipoprotein N-acyltransferase|nr:apolipoprotein N-acyltransferase [Alphaproteobacteria bacterium]
MTTRAGPAQTLRHRLSALAGWRRWVVLSALGVMAALALPPLYLLPLLIPAFSGLLWAVEDSPGPKAAFADGWWFGFGFSAAGLYWVGLSFFVDAAQYGWMAPFAIAGMAAGMALFPALAAALSRWVFAPRAAPLPALGRVLVFAALWTWTEWLRGWVLTGFPWNLIGTVWTASDAIMQMAAITGVYGLSLLTLIVASIPAGLADKSGGWRAIAIAFAVLGAIWAGGAVRLSQATSDTVSDVRLRLVQPNIPQALKWKPELRRKHVLKQIAMSRTATEQGSPPTHVIWAETSVPYVIDQTPGLAKTLGLAAPPGGLIIVGAPRATARGTKPSRLWNSLLAIDPQGQITGAYDKYHLVPFGEYVPFRGLLPIEKLTAGRQDFSPGPGVRTLTLQGLPPLSPLICYEVIFPGRVAHLNRPAWLLNLTNDGWFGVSSGPYQHFASARLRAVEEGLPLVRVANTGISGVVDGYGRTVRRLGLGREGILDSKLPVALSERTPFSRLGDWMSGFLLLVVVSAGLALRRIVYKRE